MTVKVACNPYVRRRLCRPLFQLLVFGMGVSGYWQGTGIFVALEAVFILWVYLTGKPGENGCASARRIALEHVELSQKSQRHAILPLAHMSVQAEVRGVLHRGGVRLAHVRLLRSCQSCLTILAPACTLLFSAERSGGTPALAPTGGASCTLRKCGRCSTLLCDLKH